GFGIWISYVFSGQRIFFNTYVLLLWFQHSVVLLPAVIGHLRVSFKPEDCTLEMKKHF
ncbi:hypothetical protein AMECASPLE_029773, partial [Ameca splendens]